LIHEQRFRSLDALLKTLDEPDPPSQANKQEEEK